LHPHPTPPLRQHNPACAKRRRLRHIGQPPGLPATTFSSAAPAISASLWPPRERTSAAFAYSSAKRRRLLPRLRLPSPSFASASTTASQPLHRPAPPASGPTGHPRRLSPQSPQLPSLPFSGFSCTSNRPATVYWRCTSTVIAPPAQKLHLCSNSRPVCAVVIVSTNSSHSAAHALRQSIQFHINLDAMWLTPIYPDGERVLRTLAYETYLPGKR
ncbi:hypothetical protein Taro_042393, partial [Colocasia esculenta]|nr:hypothetical protein [Colocasia esculenta]